MNSRQSWLLSCLSEKNCRRCMYRYAWATRTLRAVVARLCLLCMQMSSPIHVLSHRRHSPFSPTPPLVQPFSLMPLPSSSSWRRSPSLRVPSFCFSAASFAFGVCLCCLRAVRLAFGVCLCCLRAVRRHQSARGADKGGGKRRWPARYRLSLQKLRVTKQFALSLILICCGRHAASRPAV